MQNGTCAIINADDLGHSEAVNDAIFALISIRRVTSATILATAPGLEDAALRSKQFPSCSFGAHLCLTEFTTVTKAGASLPFVDSEGRFDSSRFAAVRPTSEIRSKIFEEWCGQIQRLQSLEVRVSHIDSHHHVHTRPWLFPVLKQVQRKFGIRKVRLSLNVYYHPEHKPSLALLTKKKIFNAALRRYYRTSTTEKFTNLRWYKLISDREKIATRSIELMTHPGDPVFAEETAILTSDWFADFAHSCRVISYDDLGN
jgi:predicted glycoside hydrolase/deacetylase ChbG (UPF0249 family)